jgi:hypothetical protein
MAQIPSAIILGGYNGSDRDEFYNTVQFAACQADIRIAVLGTLDCANIKDCMKKVLDQLMPDKEEGLPVEMLSSYCDFDIDRLVEARRICENPRQVGLKDSDI